MIKDIVIIGSGNLATNIAIALKSINCNILQIYSKNIDNAKLLANKVNSLYTNNKRKLVENADMYLVVLPDRVIENFLNYSAIRNSLIVHCSGSTNKDIFKNYTNNYGVLYPLQSFNKNKIVDFKNIPICIEANNIENEIKLENLANKLSNNVIIMDSEKRLNLHIAAVLVSNFPNHIYTLADDMLAKNNMSFDLLKPLIVETTNKILIDKPINCQTGPAIRNDKNVIKIHLELLNKFPVLKKIYTFVSNSIIKHHRVNKQDNETL